MPIGVAYTDKTTPDTRVHLQEWCLQIF